MVPRFPVLHLIIIIIIRQLIRRRNMSIKSLQGRLPHFDGAAFSVLAFSVAQAVIRPVQAVTEDIFIP